MDKNTPKKEAGRRIWDIVQTGCTDDGRDIRCNFRMEDKSTEWFAIHHSRLGVIISALMFGGSLAKQNRPNTTELGNK